MSPSIRPTNILEFAPIRRRASARSHEKQKIAEMVDKGRSPAVPFVSGMRNNIHFRRGTSIKQKRNFSPPEKFLRKETSSAALMETSQDEIESHESHSSNKTRRPEDLIQKYKNFKVNSLKLSVYKDVTLRIF